MNSGQIWQIALIGATGSGKSAMALEIASKYNGIILSLDSLAIYRKINIASAKPSPEELTEIPHYGINILEPDEPFNVTCFTDLYRRAKEHALKYGCPLLVVGGSSFYLKVLLNGISPLPDISETVRERAKTLLDDLPGAYSLLRRKAPNFSKALKPTDRYRIEKGLLILLQTGEDPLAYFEKHPPLPVISEPMPVFEISLERAVLRKKIERRTDGMLDAGLLDEISALEYTYGRSPNSMKAIGIVEVLAYFDGLYDYQTMRQKIITNTARLAKRQQTFNRSQFEGVIRDTPLPLEKKIISTLG